MTALRKSIAILALYLLAWAMIFALGAFPRLIRMPGDLAKQRGELEKPSAALDAGTARGPMERALLEAARERGLEKVVADTEDERLDPKRWAAACDAGDTDSCVRLAPLLLHVLGRPTEGIDLLREACRQGRLDACFDAADVLASPHVPMRRPVEALALFRTACVAGTPVAAGCSRGWDPVLVDAAREGLDDPGEPRLDLWFAALDLGCTLGDGESCRVLADAMEADGHPRQGGGWIRESRELSNPELAREYEARAAGRKVAHALPPLPGARDFQDRLEGQVVAERIDVVLGPYRSASRTRLMDQLMIECREVVDTLETPIREREVMLYAKTHPACARAVEAIRNLPAAITSVGELAVADASVRHCALQCPEFENNEEARGRAAFCAFASYRYSLPGTHGGGGDSLQGWEIADSSGRFTIPGREKISKHWITISYDSLPTIKAYHPRYGWTSERLQTEAVTRAIPWDRVELEFHDDRPNASGYYRELVERSPISSCDFADAALCRVYCTMTYPGRDGC